MPTLLYECLHGSRAFGIATERSDEDLKGVIVGPPAWYFGVEPGPEQLELSKDHVRFEVRKFLRLGLAANPTILEMLFVDPTHHRTVTPAGQRLLDARAMFLTQRVGETFGGYALSQLARIKTHRRWLLEPPAGAPSRADFGLPERRTLPKDQLGAAEAMLADGRLTDEDLPENFLERLDRERRYRTAKSEWKKYNQWRTHRNEARAALEAKFGYDTKHAQHLVRLLRMGVEVLETGEVHVTRDDRDELLAIREGALSYDALMETTGTLRDRLKDAAKTTALPQEADAEATEALSVALITDVLEAQP